MNLKPTMFREYDIRGIVGEDITEDIMSCIGRAYAKYMQDNLHTNTVVIGRDGRLHSKQMSDAVVRGVTECGIDIIDIGEVPSPVVYYAANTMAVDGFLMVTASHNPSEYNGIKLGIGKAALHGDAIQQVYEIAAAGDFPIAEKKGAATQHDIVPAYMEDVVGRIHLTRPLKVVLDGGNGVSGPIAVPVFEKLGCDVVPLYCDVDGTFPNHHPDPTKPANLKDLIAKVRETGADLGIGFDGDGDRLGGCDETGKHLPGDRLLALYARQVLEEVPGARIIGEVKCSRGMYEDIEKHGGHAEMYRTGHSLIKARMKETGAEIAGEMSGHIFFKHRWYGFDDGVYAGARLVEIVANSGTTLSALLSSIPERPATPEMEIKSTDATKFQVVKRATEYFQQQGLEVVTIDGARIEYPDGWGLLRASNTAPKLVVRVEADTEERVDAIKKVIMDKVDEFNQ
ncbi:MAG: phosphomannomutase/phosphoglucomutase [Candidatus Hydrogenedentota bacterium]